MEWLGCIRTAIDYMERHLEEDISVQDVADRVYLLGKGSFRRGRTCS